MATRRFTREELLFLRGSPLVMKPENLPAIEQWIDESAQHATAGQHDRHKSGDGTQRQHQRGDLRAHKSGLGGGVTIEPSPMGSFSAGSGRPTLGTRNSALRGANGDDTLGPPRTMFPSSRNVVKLSDFQDKSGGDAAAGDEPESARSRFPADRALNRRSANDKDTDSKDVWTQARDRKQRIDHDDEKRGLGRHDKEHDGDRRNGHGDRHDPRWSRDETRRNNDRPTGGWREREAARRAGGREAHEDTPEWADDPLAKKEQEIGLEVGAIKTADDFEAWKKSMKKGSKVESEKEPLLDAPEIETPVSVQQPKPTVAPLKLDGFETGFFGGFGNGSASASTPAASTPAGKASGKGKTSRFASMFKAPEPEPAPESVEDSKADAHIAAKATAEDQEGFNKVLQMLGGGLKFNTASAPAPTPPNREAISSSPPHEPPGPSLPPQQSGADPMPNSLPPQPQFKGNGTVGRKSRFAGMFAGEQKSPERLQSPSQLGDSMFDSSNRGINEELFRQPERQASEHQVPRSQPLESAISPAPGAFPYNVMREQQPRPGSDRPKEIFDPPSRGAASPDINIQDLLARQSRSRQQHATSSQSQDLLNLLTKGGSSNSRPQSGQAVPSNSTGIDEEHFSQWLRSQQQQRNAPEPHAPKPRIPQQPPGLFEEQLMRKFAETQRHEQQMQRMPYEMAEKRAMARPPPGFIDEQAAFMQHQQQHQRMRQQQYGGDAGPPMPQQMPQQTSRRPSAHPGLPQMQAPQQQQHQQDFQQMTSPIGGGAPPPGFPSHMPRHPPGFHGMNMYQEQPPRQQAPPGFGGPMSPQGNAPPGFFFSGGQGMPPGFQAMRGPGGMPMPGRVPANARGWEEYPGEVRR